MADVLLKIYATPKLQKYIIYIEREWILNVTPPIRVDFKSYSTPPELEWILLNSGVNITFTRKLDITITEPQQSITSTAIIENK